MNANKMNKLFLILGVGIGLVIASLLNMAYPKIKYISYTDEQIIERAKDLGMVSLKEVISITQDNREKNKENDEDENIEKEVASNAESEEGIDDNIIEENIVIEFVINKGENSEQIINKLFEAEIINDKDEFTSLIIEKNVQKKFKYGVFQLEKNMGYDLLIKELTRR